LSQRWVGVLLSLSFYVPFLAGLSFRISPSWPVFFPARSIARPPCNGLVAGISRDGGHVLFLVVWFSAFRILSTTTTTNARDDRVATTRATTTTTTLIANRQAR
jgi:hypothetical protein